MHTLQTHPFTAELYHNALIPSVPYTDFEILNLTSQTVFIVFLGLLYDFGATPIPCFVDYFTVEPSRAKSHFIRNPSDGAQGDEGSGW